MAPTDTVTVERRVAASPATVYALVSDVTRMGEWSPETTSCRWLGGASRAAVGARFRGTNRSGRRQWSTTCTVVQADPATGFGFEVKAGPVAIARWTYDLRRDGDGCVVTETWTDQRARWMTRAGTLLTGVADRAEHNRRTMEQTLERLASAAEAAG